MNKETLFTILLLLGVSVGIAIAQQSPSEGPQTQWTTSEEDIQAGEKIAKEGTKSGATACFVCHGLKGSENLTGQFPRIAQQPALYLATQLKDYATGVRINSVMEPIAKNLSEAERKQVAAYYSSLEMASKKLSSKIKGDIKRGQILATVGDAKIRLQACNNCHGPGGIGLAPAIPYLAGQFGAYIETQLKAWKSGQRKNSPGQMNDIVQRLDEKDMAALAAYFEQVQRTPPKKVR
ncbi:c-type cytochrome [Bdellovibrio sp. BCCA]|uniref:c-type cytochrome n=1 Tax=Bdellovibrio sp. BCCA TaxID=3136281 RepID=UPI0030F07478